MSDVLIEAQNLARHYDVRRGMFSAKATVKAVADVSLTVRQGRTLAIVGESGCGKSTLARMLTMIEPPSAGSLVVSGTDVSDGDPAKIRALR
jgi:dipeptide transport system ATP-binding protein